MSSENASDAQPEQPLPVLDGKEPQKVRARRVGLFLDVKLFEEIQKEAGQYAFRSATMRDLMREGITARRLRRAELAKAEAEVRKLQEGS